MIAIILIVCVSAVFIASIIADAYTDDKANRATKQLRSHELSQLKIQGLEKALDAGTITANEYAEAVNKIK